MQEEDINEVQRLLEEELVLLDQLQDIHRQNTSTCRSGAFEMKLAR